MKRAIFLLVCVFGLLFAFYGNSTNAVQRQFAERFDLNGETDQKGTTGDYSFDKAHSFIGFKVRHMGLIDVPGFFRDFTGSVKYNAEDVTKSSVEFTAKVASIDTGVQARDNHLRSADFFEVEKHADLTFKSTKVEKQGDGWMVTGDLMIKGETRSVNIPFNITGFLPGNQRNGPRMGITGETTINRRDFGVTYGSNVPGTDIPQIGNDVKVVLQIEAVMPKEEAKEETKAN